MRTAHCFRAALRLHVASLLVACSLVACEKEPETSEIAPDPSLGSALPNKNLSAEEAKKAEEAFNRQWPLHGLVTGAQLVVYKEPDGEAPAVGFLRVGNRIRAKDEPQKKAGCASGWYPIAPIGWVCAGQGITFAEQAPNADFEVPPPNREQALPYQYWYSTESMVPEYHRLPSRDEQREARDYVARYHAILEKSEKRGAMFLAGELKGEPSKPAVVHRFLDRGFYVAGIGTEVRAFRNFVRTVRGRYVKQVRMEERTGSEFSGVELDDKTTLPVVWAVRTSRPMIRRDKSDGSVKFVDDQEAVVYERHERIEGWQARENVAGHYYHRFKSKEGEERFVRDWFFAIADKVERPKEVKKGVPWVHVNLATQTLVLYENDKPTYATLISSGLEGHETPTGVFPIERKYVADTMADLGSNLDDRYSIEDVPWTQYFHKSIALHAAFWHTRFGLQKSHGCVNLAPQDALRIFEATSPAVPQGWLGIVTAQTPYQPSYVYVTN